MFDNSIKLSCGPWKAELLLEFGCNLIGLWHNGDPVLRYPKSIKDLQEKPEVYGIPLLFPPNRTKNGLFTFNQKEYSLEINEPARHNHIHGKMHTAPFVLQEKTEQKAVCVYQNNGERFPFLFKMIMTYELTQTGLQQSLTIVNTGTEPMPVLLAFHTSFVEPEIFSAPILNRWEVDENYIPTGKMLELTEKEQQYITGFDLHNQVVSGFFKSAGKMATVGKYGYKVSDNFTQWILYNGGGSGNFLCIEPQSGPVNGLNMPDGHLTLSPEDSVTFETEIFF